MKNTGRIINSICLIFILLILSSAVFAEVGDLDPNFEFSAYGQRNHFANDFAEQTDGKFLFAGAFAEANGDLRNGIVRYNPDGSVDQTFNPPLFYSFAFSRLITAFAIQNDGKIVVGGNIDGYGSTAQRGVFRLNPDGSLDTSFTNANLSDIEDIKVLPDNKILVAGRSGVAKLNSDGTLMDQTGQIDLIIDMEVLPDGKIYVSSRGNNALRRLNADLTFDLSFTTVTADAGANPDIIYSIKVLANEQLIVSGTFDSLNGVNLGRIAKINSDGSLDLSFNLNGAGADHNINSANIKSNGKIIISGRFTEFNGQAVNSLIQLNADGTIDNSFQTPELNGFLSFTSFLNSNEDILLNLFSSIFQTNVALRNFFIKVQSNGMINSSFDVKLTRDGIVHKIKQVSNGKIYIAGLFRYANELESWSIARLNLDGSVDPTFVSAFNQFAFPEITDFEIQDDGKLLVTSIGQYSTFSRLNTDGSFDTTFNSSTLAGYDVALLPDGKILAAQSNSLRRYNADGTLDPTFNEVTANQLVDSVRVQTDGKIIIAGYFTQIDGSSRGRIARLDADGTLDNTFNPTASNVVFDVELQPNGKILVAGLFTSLNGSTSQNKIGRLNADGTLDSSFSQNADGPIYKAKRQSDGKIWIGGIMSFVGGIQKLGFARLNSDGSLDTSITANSPVGVNDIDIQSDNKILFGGKFVTVNGEPKVRVARLLNDPIVASLTDHDFDGDGLADIGVFRPSSNIWYQLIGPNYSFSQTSFGISGDIVAPADFDGDGKSDLAIFRPANGNWWFLSSVTNTQVNVQFGQNGDIPRPSDFDGDGKADFILFRPSISQWLRFGSTGATSTVSFGLTGDKPLVGDFDGDGKSDVAIYRPTTGDWWWQSSKDNVQRATHWGISTDIPSPGDYDGDGITDFAVYRPDTGVWYVLNSSSGNTSATIIKFGISEDKPVPADYDGDGKVDIAVYRPSTGVWYLLRSTDGFQAIQFGVATDIPLPNALIP